MQILLIAESKAQYDDRLDRFRFALISHDPSLTPKLFDEAKPKKEEPKETADPNEALEAEAVEFTSVDFEEAERVLAAMLANPQGSARALDWS